MCIFLLVQIYNKKILQFIIPIIALSTGAVLTFSRGPVLGLGIMLTFLALNPKIHRAGGSNFRLILFIVLLTGALYLFLTTAYPESTLERYGEIIIDTGRQNAWNRSIELWQQKPLTGWGVGSWAIIYPRFYQARISDAHNFVFQILVETGLVGISLTTIFLLSVLFPLLIKRRFADLGILAYIVSVGLVENWKIAIFFGLFALIFLDNNPDLVDKQPKDSNAFNRF
jgi:O-antigen ligase